MGELIWWENKRKNMLLEHFQQQTGKRWDSYRRTAAIVAIFEYLISFHLGTFN